MEIILDSNESNYSNPVKDSKADFDHQLAQLSLLLKGVLKELNDLKVSHAAILAAHYEMMYFLIFRTNHRGYHSLMI